MHYKAENVEVVLDGEVLKLPTTVTEDDKQKLKDSWRNFSNNCEITFLERQDASVSRFLEELSELDQEMGRYEEDWSWIASEEEMHKLYETIFFDSCARNEKEWKRMFLGEWKCEED